MECEFNGCAGEVKTALVSADSARVAMDENFVSWGTLSPKPRDLSFLARVPRRGPPRLKFLKWENY